MGLTISVFGVRYRFQYRFQSGLNEKKIANIHVMSLKVASGRFFFHFREVFEKSIDYIGKFLVHFREVLKFS